MTKHFWVEFFYFLSLDLLLSCMKIYLTKWWWQWWLQLLLDIFCRLSVWGSMIVRAYSVSCSRFNLMIPPPVSPENNNKWKKQKTWSRNGGWKWCRKERQSELSARKNQKGKRKKKKKKKKLLCCLDGDPTRTQRLTVFFIFFFFFGRN